MLDIAIRTIIVDVLGTGVNFSSQMAKQMRRLVSKQKRRYTSEGFDLDLAYICPNILAMGFPSENLEGFYRNSMEEVVRFLDLQHENNYKVYNLCSERWYDSSKFYGRVARFPFDDHNAPPFELITSFCEDVCQYLEVDDRNVAAVHCKAGKGRTGVMISCYLIHTNRFKTVPDALNYFGAKRTMNAKGVTIPSQRRYVEYYGFLRHNELTYRPVTAALTSFVLDGLPNFPSLAGCNYNSIFFTVSTHDRKVFSSQPYSIDFRWKRKQILLDLGRLLLLTGDFKVEFFISRLGAKEKVCHFWLNPFFLEMAHLHGDGELYSTQTSVLTGDMELRQPQSCMQPASPNPCHLSSCVGFSESPKLQSTQVRRRSSSVGSFDRTLLKHYVGCARKLETSVSITSLSQRFESFTSYFSAKEENIGKHASDPDIKRTVDRNDELRGRLGVDIPQKYMHSGDVIVVSLPKRDLDKANKDHRHFDDTFVVHSVFSLSPDFRSHGDESHNRSFCVTSVDYASNPGRSVDDNGLDDTDTEDERT